MADFAQLLTDLSDNPQKAVELKADPHDVLSSYELTEEEHSALLSGDPAKIHAAVSNTMKSESFNLGGIHIGPIIVVVVVA